ncbi:MAG TPA: PQQ-dependent sugar dehydrogenase [Actinomycetota bacterium]
MRHARLAVAAILIAATLATPAAAAGLEPRPFLDDLAFPTNMAFLPDGTLLFTEKETGNVRVVAPDGRLVDQPFITLPVIGDAERGLLGIAVHPDFERDPWVYLYRSDPRDGLNRLVRVRAAGPVAEGQPETLLDGISAVAGYHNGGDLAFGADGSLFVALGEAHEADRAQDETDIGGKIARLTAAGDVPPDNPFGPDNPVWSIGHRNSFGLCVDPATGTLWETENGPDVDDEVNVIEPGGNYGWPAVTGISDEDEFIDPLLVFRDTIALTGCAVAGGDLWFGSFDGRLWRVPASADAAVDAEEIARFPAGVTDVLLGPDDALYVATADSIWTLRLEGTSGSTPTPTPTPARPDSPSATPSPQVVATADDGNALRPWIAVAALAALAGALGARFVAGRRLRQGDPGDDR